MTEVGVWDHLCQSFALFDWGRSLRVQIGDPDEQFAAISVVDDSLDYQQPALAKGARATDDSVPDPRGWLDSDPDGHVYEIAWLDYRILGTIKVDAAVVAVRRGREDGLSPEPLDPERLHMPTVQKVGAGIADAISYGFCPGVAALDPIADEGPMLGPDVISNPRNRDAQFQRVLDFHERASCASFG